MHALALEPADPDLAALVSYYRSPAVRARIAEYCGGEPSDPGSFTAVSLAGYGGTRHLRSPEGAPIDVPFANWPLLLEEGADVCRSLGDRMGTLLMFDVDYVNQADPVEPYRDPARTFACLEPVYEATLRTLAGHGIRPLTLVTGRGYHFVVKAAADSPFERTLVKLGTPRPLVAGDSLVDGRAHDGAGRLLEHLAHEVMRSVVGQTEVPLSVIDKPPIGGGPFICLDITAYGDPLASRNSRCAFSGNQKAKAQGLPAQPALVAVLPRSVQPLQEIFGVRADLGCAAEWAQVEDVSIPLVHEAEDWTTAYRSSALFGFHRYFDEGLARPDPIEADLPWLPPCVTYPLSLPNAALLTPGWLRTVALTLWAQGWHPQSIVSLVMSRYAREHGWGDYWERYDRETRASFYVRLCCGALADDVEDWTAFSCEAQRGSGFCPGETGGCGLDLRTLGPNTRRGRP